MFNAINTKLLLAITLALASIAGSLAYRNKLEAKKEADLTRAKAARQQAAQIGPGAWRGSAATIQSYRPK